MKELLHDAASRGIVPEYVNTLLDAFEDLVLTYTNKSIGEVNVSTETTTHNSLALQSSGILSLRELEVLQLMASGASSKEVSSELFISVGTVRKHIVNIYRKLDVHKQTTAVARAQELGLI